MINQQLLDYIKQQLQQSINKEQIKNSLISNGWQAQDIEEGFNAVNISLSSEQYSNFPTKTPTKTWKIIAASLIGIVVIGGGVYLITQKFFKTEQTPRLSNELTNRSPVDNQPVENTPAPELPVKQLQETKGIVSSDTFPDKLNSCTKYKTKFVHPLTGETLEKEILGIINGKCNYVEQMPNGGKMECKFTESIRIAAVKYYKDVAAAESAETSVMNLGSGEQKTTSTIDGKVVENPLQEALNSGICVISGY